MIRNLVTLVGEQPLPTLLAIRHLDAKEVLFVGTREWHNVSQHMQALFENGGDCSHVIIFRSVCVQSEM
jgi:hypothetical protein